MNFYSALLRTFPRNPARAGEALYWHVTGKRVRARNRLRAVLSESSHAYRDWILWREHLEDTLARAPAMMESWPERPRISIVLYHPPGEPIARLEKRIAALEAQCYGDWELVLAQSRETPHFQAPNVPRFTLVAGRTDNPYKALHLGIQAASGDYILPLGPEALLAPHALYRFGKAVLNNPDASVFYADEDIITTRGHRETPWFKPQWNPELFLAQDYLSGACLIRREDALALPPLHPALSEAGLYAMLLTLTSAPQAKVVHVPHVLAHHPAAPTAQVSSEEDTLAARTAVVTNHVSPLGAKAEVGPFGSVAVEWPLPDPRPLVSVIIPTRDHATLLRHCVTGVLNATRYRNVEIIIVDNGSRDADTLDYLRRVAANPRVTILHDDGDFNFSRLNNLAARAANGDYLCLLNNDIEIIDEAWLSALMRQAARPGIGAVGAKLLYDDHSIQHAGVTIGLGQAAGHAHRFLKNDDPGYFARAHVPHYVSAVTGACLLVEKAKFWEVGGLDEAGFPVAFNDVDFCLKLQAAGYHNIYEPRSILIHHESKSRGKDFRADNLERYMRELALLQQRWNTATVRDPLHHRALDRSIEAYHIAV